MKKIFLVLILIFCVTPITHAEFGDSSYVSPESYAVNEADMLDYLNIPRAPKIHIDELDNSNKFVESAQENMEIKKAAAKKNKRIKTYEDTLKYKFARWWVDERYKREEVHHGGKHEIKVQKRIEKENEQNNKKTVDN